MDQEERKCVTVERTDHAEHPERQSPANKKARGPEMVKWEGRKWLRSTELACGD